MAFSSAAAAALAHSSSSCCLSSFPQTLRRKIHLQIPSIRLIKAAAADAEPDKEKATAATTTTSTQTTQKADGSSNAQPQTKAPAAAAAKPLPKKPVYSMKKGQIVRVDKEKYLNSINDNLRRTIKSFANLLHDFRSWIYAFLRPENMHLLHGLASQQHQLGFPQTCLSSLRSSTMRDCEAVVRNEVPPPFDFPFSMGVTWL